MSKRRATAFTAETGRILSQVAAERRNTPRPGFTAGVAARATRGWRFVVIDGEVGETVTPTMGGFFAGHVVLIDPSADWTDVDGAPFTEGAECFIAVINRFNGSSDPDLELIAGERYIAEPLGDVDLDGSAGSEGGPKPLYVIYNAAAGEATGHWIAKTNGAAPAFTTGHSVSIMNPGWVDSGDDLTGVENATSVDIGSGKRVKITRIKGVKYMELWEC